MGRYFLSHYYLLKSCFLAQILEGVPRKSRKPEELCLAQRRRDAGWGRWLRVSDLCASASLREKVLVAAGGRAGYLAYFAVASPRWSAEAILGPRGHDHAKQDAHDKSRSQPNRSLISARKRRSKPDLGTFVVSIKQTQFRGARRSAEYPVFHYAIVPPFQSGAHRAKRSQFVDCALGIAD
jgi:hypothetical protein